MLICEIGTYQGAAADLFASCCRFFYSVDPWVRKGKIMQNVRDCYYENMVAHGNYCHYQEPGMDAVNRFQDGFLDMVYIDANHDHDSVVVDIEAWMPKLKPDGFLCGHDFPGRKGDVETALLATIGPPDVTFADKSWVIQFKGGKRV